jgi:hypothetical protein
MGGTCNTIGTAEIFMYNFNRIIEKRKVYVVALMVLKIYVV